MLSGSINPGAVKLRAVRDLKTPVNPLAEGAVNVKLRSVQTSPRGDPSTQPPTTNAIAESVVKLRSSQNASASVSSAPSVPPESPAKPRVPLRDSSSTAPAPVLDREGSAKFRTSQPTSSNSSAPTPPAQAEGIGPRQFPYILFYNRYRLA